MDNDPNLQSIVPQFRSILDRIAQAKNNPQEVQRTVDEGKQQLENLTQNQQMSSQPQSQSQSQPQSQPRR